MKTHNVLGNTIYVKGTYDILRCKVITCIKKILTNSNWFFFLFRSNLVNIPNEINSYYAESIPEFKPSSIVSVQFFSMNTFLTIRMFI